MSAPKSKSEAKRLAIQRESRNEEVARLERQIARIRSVLDAMEMRDRQRQEGGRP